MKTKTLLSLGIALSFSSVLVFGSSLAYASVATGPLSAGVSAPSSGSVAGGTLSGGAIASNTISGTVSSGSSGGGGGGGSIGIVASNGGGSSGSIGVTTPTSVVTTTPGSVLGVSTDVSNVPSTSGGDSLTDQGNIALANTTGTVSVQANAPLTAAVDASGFTIAWWVWAILLVLLVGASVYYYQRYYSYQ